MLAIFVTDQFVIEIFIWVLAMHMCSTAVVIFLGSSQLYSGFSVQPFGTNQSRSVSNRRFTSLLFCRKIFLLILFVLSVTTDNWYSVPSPRNHLQASLPSPQSRISRFILLYVNQAICFTLPRDNAYLSGTLVCLTTFEMCRLRHTIKVNLVCLIKVKGTISRQP